MLFYAPLVWLAMFLLLDLLFYSFCLIWCSFCLTCSSTPFVWPALLFLFNLLLHSFCSTSLLRCLFATPMILLLPTPLVRPCYFALLVLDWYSPPPPFFCRCGVWRSCPNSSFSNSSSLRQTWKARIFVFNFCFLMSSINYPCFWEMVVNNVLVFLCKNYLDIVHLIIHIAFHLHNCIVYFLSTLHFFLSISCKCLGWFSYNWHNIILANNRLTSNFSFKEDNIMVKNVGVKSKWKFNFDWKNSNKWKWNGHWRRCENRRKWKCANKKITKLKKMGNKYEFFFAKITYLNKFLERA